MISFSFAELLHKWAYFFVFIWSMVEGESVVLLASVAASQGKLNIYKVGLCAFSGTLISEQILYFVGRWYGGVILNRYPLIAAKSARILEFLRKYNTIFILTSRFMYGIRSLTPFVIGVAGVPIRHFFYLNFIAAMFWAILSCSAGYFLGEVVLKFLQHSSGALFYALIIILIIVITYLLQTVIKMMFKNK